MVWGTKSYKPIFRSTAWYPVQSDKLNEKNKKKTWKMVKKNNLKIEIRNKWKIKFEWLKTTWKLLGFYI